MLNRYFKNINGLEELRKQYKTLLKQFHPDNGGSEEAAKEINIEYECIFAVLSKEKERGKECTAYDEKGAYSADIRLRGALNKIISLNVDIEICGSWIWVTGNTYPVKEILKEAGFKYSKSKKSWYFGEIKHKKKTSMAMDKIRELYGSEKVGTKQELIRA